MKMFFISKTSKFMKKSKLKYFSLIFGLLTVLSSCDLDENKKYDKQILEFIIEITGEKNLKEILYLFLIVDVKVVAI